jgi:hypothetical protein
MPIYTVKSRLLYNNKTYEPGTSVEMSVEEALATGGAVVAPKLAAAAVSAGKDAKKQ